MNKPNQLQQKKQGKQVHVQTPFGTCSSHNESLEIWSPGALQTPAPERLTQTVQTPHPNQLMSDC
jgi:hypothetical protein